MKSVVLTKLAIYAKVNEYQELYININNATPFGRMQPRNKLRLDGTRKNMKNIQTFVKSLLGVAVLLGSFAFVGQAFAFTPSYEYGSAAATNITSNSATLNATFNPNGLATTAWFEVDNASTHYGTTNLASGSGNVPYSYTLSSLSPNSTHSFRAVAQNSDGTTWSYPWKVFTTLPNNNPPPTCPPGQVGTPPNCTYPPQQDAPTVNLTANPPSIQQGQSSTLTWSVSDATSCFASGGWSGNKNPNGGQQTVSPSTTTTYTLTCTGPGGSGSDSATITVTQTPPPPQAPSVTLTASPTQTVYGGSTLLVWTVQNATSCIGNSSPVTSWGGAKNPNGGSQTVSGLTSTTFFNIYCTNAAGQSDSATVTVTVGAQPVNVPTVNLTASPTSVTSGGSMLLSWTSTNATFCNASSSNSQWNGTVVADGSKQVSNLTSTTTFSITCTNTSGSASDSVTVSVTSVPTPDNPTVTTHSPTNIGTTYATLNGYVNPNGNSNVSAWFEWGTGSNYGNQTPQNTYNSATNFSYSLGGLQPNTTYYYRAVAQGPNGMVYGSQMSFTTTGGGCTYNCGGYSLPMVTTYSASNIGTTYATLNGYVDPNGSNGTRWFEWSTSNGFLSNSTTRVYMGSYAQNISETLSNLSPNTTYYFRAAAQNNYGTTYGNVLSFVTTGNIIVNPCGLFGSCQPTAVTTFATNIGTGSARLNGLGIQNAGATSLTGYFEWGITRALGNTTVPNFIGNGSSNPFFASVFGLEANTTYYYRAVVTNQNGGISRGDIVTFRTGTVLGTGVVVRTPNPSLTYRETTLVTNTNTNTVTTGVSKASLVFLDTNCNNQVLRPGDTLQCTVHWKNVSQKNLTNVLLRVGFPEELEFKSATFGNFSPVDNAVVVEIGNLAPQQEGSMTFTTVVGINAELGKIIVIASNLVYSYIGDNGALAQEEVFSYSEHSIQSNLGSIAGAAIFANGSFVPTSLMGWLLLILLILLILLAAKMVYHSIRPKVVVTQPTASTVTTTH
jgi:hypothetical protein